MSSAARPRIATMIASVPVNGRLLELDARVAVAAGDVLADGELPEVVAPRTLPPEGVLLPVVLSPRTWPAAGWLAFCVAAGALDSVFVEPGVSCCGVEPCSCRGVLGCCDS